MNDHPDSNLHNLLWATRLLVTAFLVVLALLAILVNRWERVTKEQVKLIEQLQKYQQKGEY